jgi:hypothetical protein
MSKRTKQALHICECATCQQHPYSRVAKDHKAINQVLAGLDERNKRRFVGLLASQQGNISLLAEITGLSRNTIYRGQAEVEYPSKNPVLVGVRRPGGGRSPVEKNNPVY